MIVIATVNSNVIEVYPERLCEVSLDFVRNVADGYAAEEYDEGVAR